MIADDVERVESEDEQVLSHRINVLRGVCDGDFEAAHMLALAGFPLSHIARARDNGASVMMLLRIYT